MGVKQRACDCHNLCRAKKRKVPASVSEAVGLATELMRDAAKTSTPGAGNIGDPRIDKLRGQLSSTRLEVVLFTAELSNLEDAHIRAG